MEYKDYKKPFYAHSGILFGEIFGKNKGSVFLICKCKYTYYNTIKYITTDYYYFISEYTSRKILQSQVSSIKNRRT